MLNYGTKYIANFRSRSNQLYTILFEYMDYAGDATDVICSDVVVLQKLQEDARDIPVRGSALEINLINKEGLLPLSEFFSVVDNYIRVRLYHNNDPANGTLYIGFIVQTDCEEPLLEYTHEISLTVTDNLALLKDVTFDQAAIQNGAVNEYDANISYLSTTSIFIDDPGLPLVTGATVTISASGAPRDGTHTVQFANYATVGLVLVTFYEPFAAPWVGFQAAHLTVMTPIDITQRMLIKDIIHLCLLPTNLGYKDSLGNESGLETWLYSTIIPTGALVDRFIDITMLSPEDFLNGNTWDSCYLVLEKIMNRFHCSLFQTHGHWVIQRWSELLRYNNATPLWKYDANMDYFAPGTFNEVFTYNNGQYEHGATSAIVRPYKFIEETFQIKTPKNLIRNLDFQDLGIELNSYTVPAADVYGLGGSGTYTIGTYLVREFEWLFWFDGPFPPIPDRFIRVVYDPNGNEIFRLGITQNATGDRSRAAKSTTTEVSQNDIIEIGGDIKTRGSQPGSSVASIVIGQWHVTDGVNTYVLRADGSWQSSGPAPVAGRIVISPGDNTNSYHSYSIRSLPLPISGLLTYFVSQDDSAGTPQESQFKNLTFTVVTALNEVTNIIAQVHTDEQPKTINNKNAYDVYMDDTARNTITGTIYKTTFASSGVQDRTDFWARQSGTGESKRLGELMTRERLYQAHIPRYKLNINFIGLIQNGIHMQPNSVIIFSPLPGRTFIFGLQTIDYKNDQMRCTLYEEWATGEDGDLTDSAYTFEYLLNNK